MRLKQQTEELGILVIKYYSLGCSSSTLVACVSISLQHLPHVATNKKLPIVFAFCYYKVVSISV